jgi:hypothetical protein
MEQPRRGESSDAGENPRTRGEPRRKAVSLAGWMVSSLVTLLALGVSGASGCGDTIDSRGEPSNVSEPVGEAQQAAKVTPTACISVRRDGVNKAYDTSVYVGKPTTNYGAATAIIVSGGVSTVPPSPRYGLFKFDLSMVPQSATVINAGVTFNQTNNGVVIGNVHKILAPWDELTVTWDSFGGAFDPTVVKTFSTAGATVSVDVLPLVKDWVSGAVPNHGVLLETPGDAKTTFKTQEWGVANLRPYLSLCYKVICGLGFEDCNNSAPDGCETSTNSVSDCGGCGIACARPNATALCPAGACTLGDCNLGFGNCDGDAVNGCETDLATNQNCGACGVPCDLPSAVSSCATGSCKVVSCNAGSFDCNGDPTDGCEPLPCGDGAHCGGDGDCQSGVCVNGFCASPACNDHAQNGGETDVDCGGPCPPCADGLGCAASLDCQSSVCQGGLCSAPSCVDAVKNGAETDLDCGGLCPPCADALQCNLAGDCQSGVCQGGLCHAPACNDGLKNGGETAVDCGGLCAACADGSACALAADCQSGVCSGGVCQMAACNDAVKNGSETDVDCGGACSPCNPNQLCVSNADCASGVCAGNHCQPPSCADGVKNGDETGVDCGGACTVPEVCNGVDDDCNGSTDEGLGSTTCGIGACQVTVQTCVGGVVQSCVPGVPAAAEDCEGHLDDDCDGTVDDGCDCVNGSTQPCYTGSLATANVGQCHGGTQTCVLGHFGACAGESTPSAEICDGLDNDCDGQADEDLGTTICGVGACQVMVQNCLGGVVQSCVPGNPGAEICDGLDNDCDGQVDEDQPVLSCGAGACATSVPSCVNGAPNACNPHATDGVACDDGHDCTQNDACNNGACAGALRPAGTLCRASAGACDAAESCTGASPDCPVDNKLPLGTTCRASAGACDVAESCDGVSNGCPNDAFAGAGTMCRPSGGVCDVAETCTGGSAACPADVKVAAGTLCRGSAGVCDVAETCNGVSNGCPNDGFAGAGTLCRGSAGPCDVAEACTGGSAACPGDSFVAGGTVCRGSAGPCDVAEACTGGSAACPGDSFVGGGTVCRGSAGPCDVAETCTGGSAACPGDSYVSAGVVCRGSSGPCDPAEACTGGSPACPGDSLSPAGTLCRGSAGVCDPAETCTGGSPACPGDSLSPAGTVCRASTGACDPAETCTGGSSACPSDVVSNCQAGTGVRPLFSNGSGYACPTGATTFSFTGPLDPTSSAQAKAACEACYGVGACYLENADCAGPGWGPNPPGQYVCGKAYFGYTSGCSGDDGRAWSICSSGTTYGYWGKYGPTCSDGVQNQGEGGVDCGGPCSTPCPVGPGVGTRPLFSNGSGYSCPTGATTFSFQGPLDPTSSAQAKAACEACYGVGACYLENADCAGPGWGPNPPGQYVCGKAYFGYTSGCSGDDGRAWSICSSGTTYGYWGKYGPTCSDGIQNQGEAGVDCGGPCNACAGSSHALFANGPGYACPTGKTTFTYQGALNPASSEQAKAACEACYGVGACYLENADCAGPGWGPNPPGQYVCGKAYFGYTSGCSGDDGRSWSICSSGTSYGWWGKY